MKSTRNPLAELIISKIRRDGPVSFSWFMEQALYHPEFGYYSSGKARLGRKGDYFTNVSVGSMFGRLLAAQFADIWEKLGRTDDLTIVEQGAHAGDFARDVLAALADGSPQCFERVRYLIVEPFPALRHHQEQALTKFRGKVIWSGSLETIQPFVGLHFSNELLDAFPVSLGSARRGSEENETEWFEKRVDWNGSEFLFVEWPVADGSLRERLESLPGPPNGFQAEFNQAALDWIDVLSAKLQRGYVLTIDYGYVQDDLVQPSHRTGTLQCRAEHQLLESPLDRVGACDITADVNWSAIAQQAVKQKFQLAGFTDQHHFLTGIISEHPKLASEGDPSSRRQLQTLLHPEMMGRSFQVLGLSRGMDPAVRLSGFKFARRGDFLLA